eukprot:TRINITY_DN10857_c0_g1_i1.p2 TRINITY_DN10857_c0_g1~~TRINITY_DN10857_c0_g1_i1.p2  ORF type:complete len:262 (+),score=83.60 TRINITY_DN10857_c0_g1_i1:217-1002(+)
MTPNTVLLSWPHQWRSPDHSDDADVFVETTAECTRLHKAMIIAYNGRHFPKLSKLQGTVDVWWIMHDGGLLILMAHLLTQHKIWVGCTIRVFVVAGRLDNSVSMQAQLETLLANARIRATVEVVELEDSQDLVAYTQEWTLRVNEARRLKADLQARQPPPPPSARAAADGGQSPSAKGGASDSWRRLTRDVFVPPKAELLDEEAGEASEDAEAAGSGRHVWISDRVNVKSIPRDLDAIPGLRSSGGTGRGTSSGPPQAPAR